MRPWPSSMEREARVPVLLKAERDITPFVVGLVEP